MSNMNITPKEEFEIISKYYPIGGAKLVKQYLPYHEGTIRRKASEYGIQGTTKYFTNKEDDIIKTVYPKNGYEGVMQLLPNRDKDSIQRRAFQLKVKYLTYDEDYFEKINTPDKAYWLGFVYTDGFVTTQNRWGIELSSVDKVHLENFAECFKCNINIKDRTRVKSDKQINCSGFMIKNTKMHGDLINNGVVMNKTDLLEFPNEDILPKHLYSHFIRGLFDGDGCMYSANREMKYVKNDGEIKTCDYIAKSISFTCNSEIFINELLNVIKGSVNIEFKIKKNRNQFVIEISKKEYIIEFIKYIYLDSNNIIRLERKYNKSKEIVYLLEN